MFILQTANDKPIDWPVTVEYAVAGGKIAKHTFTGFFLLLDDDRREAIMGSNAAPESDPEADPEADPDAGGESAAEAPAAPAVANAWKDDTIDAILKVMTGWKGVVDQNRNPIEFTRENLRTAARSPHGVGLLRGINTAIAEIATGARAKN